VPLPPRVEDAAMRALVTAASKHGATAEIAAAIGEGLRRRGLEVAVVPAELAGSVSGYDAVVLGSAVYGGHWLPPALELAERSAAALRSHPVWLFSSGPVGDPSRKLVQKMGVDPVELPKLTAAVAPRGHRTFSGRLARKNLPFVQRAALFFFRGLEGDFRDWDEIDAWAGAIAESLMATPAPAHL
jgi:menaquinone-dependent protoporphyrinogen oxidase